MAIIGILAAVAIPAYNKYQQNARAGTISGSLNQISKAFNACLAVGTTAATCFGTAITTAAASQTLIDSTVRLGPNIFAKSSKASTNTAFCFELYYTGVTGEKGCIELNTIGVGIASTETQIKDGSDGTCNATSGVCTP